MINTSHAPIKASHQIALSTKNNTFLRNKQFFGKQDPFNSAPLNLDHQTSERIFQNNQIIAQKINDAKAQRLHRTSSLGFLDTSAVDQIKSLSLDKNPSSTLLKEGRRALAQTLRMPKNGNSGMSPHEKHFKPAKGSSNHSSLCDPSLDQFIPKLEDSMVDHLAVAKEVKAMKRFNDDRKQLRKTFKQKSDISHLTDLKREPPTSNRDLQILELHLASQSQLSSPVLDLDLSSKKTLDEPKSKLARSANASPSNSRDRSLVKSGFPSLANLELPRPTIRFLAEQPSPHSDRPQYLQVDTHRSYDQKSIRFNNVLLTPITNQATHLSREFFPENKFHEGALLNLENLQADGYLGGFSEAFSATCSPIKHNTSVIPKICDNSDKKPSKLSKSRWEEMLDNQTLLEDLKKEIPNIMSAFPPSRSDTVALSHWIEEKLKAVLESTGLTEKQKCMQCDEIYNVGLNEIIRQVRFDCAERAELLSRIWMSYLRVFNQFKLSLLADQAKLHDEHEDTYNRVHKMYKDMMAETIAERDKLRVQLQDSIAEKNAATRKYDKMAKREAKILQKNRDLRSLLKKTAKEMERLKEDNEAMNIRLLARNILLPTSKPESELSKKNTNVPRPSTRVTTGTGQSPMASPLKAATSRKEEIAEEKDSTATEISSEDLEYEMDNDEEDDEEVREARKAESVHKIEQLNSLALVHFVPDVVKYFENRDIQTGPDLYNLCHSHAECQTDLKLLNVNYDELFSNQSNVDELVIDHKLKKEVEVIGSAASFDLMGYSSEAGSLREVNDSLRPSKSRPRIQTNRFSYSDLEGEMRSPEDIAKKKAHLISHKGRQKHSGLGHPNRDSGRSRKLSHKSRSSFETPGTLNTAEDEMKSEHVVNRESRFFEGSIDKKAKELNESGSEGLADQHNNSGSHAEEERKQESRDSHEVGGVLRNSITEVSEKEENKFSEVEERGDKSASLEMSTLVVDYDSKAESNDERGGTHEDSGELQINLDELDPSDLYSSDENRSSHSENDSQADFSIIVEDEAEDLPQSTAVLLSPKNKETQETPGNKEFLIPPVKGVDLDKKLNEDPQEKAENTTLPQQQPQAHVVPPRESAGKRLSIVLPTKSNQSRVSIRCKVGPNSKINALHHLATIKNRIDKFMLKHHIGIRGINVDELIDLHGDNQGEDLDRTKYMQLVKLYKIEAEKTKILQHTITELKENLEKEGQAKLSLHEENEKIKLQLNELENQIAELKVSIENSYPKCRHGRCQYCLSEEAAAREEEEKAANEDDDDAINRRRRRKKDLIKNKTTQAQTIQFNRRNAVDRKDNPAPAIIAKLKTKKMSQFKNFMPLKMILKQINSLYDERLKFSRENPLIRDEELSCFVYNTYLNLFGFKKIAEQKFIVLILSIKKNMHILRVNVFGRFLGLIEGAGNYNLDEFNKYIECLDFLNNCNMGANIISGEGEPKLYTPYVRFLEYLKTFAEGKLGIEEYVEFKKEFDAIKEVDPKNVNRYGVIDVDMALMKVLSKYRIASNRVKQFVIDAYQAMDIDGEKACDLRKFKLLFKYLESDKYDEEYANDVFEDYAEANAKGVLLLSYDKFAALCVDLNLFSEYQQDKYLMITKKEQIAERFFEIRKESAELRHQMETNLNNVKDMDEKERKVWEKNIEYVWKRVLNVSVSEKDYKGILITISIMRDELQKLQPAV